MLFCFSELDQRSIEVENMAAESSYNDHHHCCVGQKGFRTDFLSPYYVDETGQTSMREGVRRCC